MGVSVSQALLTQYNENAYNFIEKTVTGYEIRIHNYDPETKDQITQWNDYDSPHPKNLKTQPSVTKVMATIGLGTENGLLIDNLPAWQNYY